MKNTKIVNFNFILKRKTFGDFVAQIRNNYQLYEGRGPRYLHSPVMSQTLEVLIIQSICKFQIKMKKEK